MLSVQCAGCPVRGVLTLTLAFAVLLAARCDAGSGLAPSAVGGVVEHAGALSNTIRQTVAWQHLRNSVVDHGPFRDRLAKFLPEKTMTLVSSFVRRFRPPGEDVLVTTSLGVLRGRVMLTKSDPPIVYYSFRGIRYGQSPVGERRFAAALPEASWSGVRDARKEGAVCPHRNLLLETFKGKEDCLFLNIHTPELPSEDSNPLLPVMVWLHGGGFSLGSGNSFLYGPDYLLPEGVVVVTMNYRLGALGYLSLQDDLVPGNAGLKDQVLALRWIREHIGNFGGDRDQVTVFGESAGGAAVQYLMVSPLARGLFHRAISQSGLALSPWALAKEPRARAFRLGEVLGVRTNSSTVLLDVLRKAPFKKIIDSAPLTLTKEDSRQNIGIPFVPSVEDADGFGGEEEVFLPRAPHEILRDGQFAKVPYMLGFNTHEAMVFIRRLRKNPSLLEIIDQDFSRMLPVSLKIPGGRYSPEGLKVAQEVRRFYLGNKTIDMDAVEEMIYLLTDTMFLRSISDSVRLMAPHTTKESQVYLYRFAFDGALGFFKRLLGINRPGACHGDELGYLFHFGIFNLHLDQTSLELLVKRRMVKMWTNFAKFGNPTPNSRRQAEVLEPIWLPATSSNTSLPYLDINEQLQVKVNPESVRLLFWDALYQKYNGSPLSV